MFEAYYNFAKTMYQVKEFDPDCLFIFSNFFVSCSFSKMPMRKVIERFYNHWNSIQITLIQFKFVTNSDQCFQNFEEHKRSKPVKNFLFERIILRNLSKCSRHLIDNNICQELFFLCECLMKSTIKRSKIITKENGPFLSTLDNLQSQYQSTLINHKSPLSFLQINNK